MSAESDAGERLKSRLEWFQDLKFGFFVHWGIYSQWGCIESWPLVEDGWARQDDLPAWVERGRDLARFRRDYVALNRTFDPVRFDPDAWADAAKLAGMKYFVFTTKHHDGFCMFDTRRTDYRITHPDCPFSRNPRANVARELFDAFKARGLGIGAYFSKSDWHHPDYWDPDAPALNYNPNYDTHEKPEKWARFAGFVYDQIEELVTDYGPIDILWLDAGQVRPPDQDLGMDRIARMARSHRPDLVLVDRAAGGEHENYLTPEQEIPERPLDSPWESCITMGDQFSYKPDDRYKSTFALVRMLVEIVSKGGNLLLNVGPGPDGALPETAVSRMREIGEWLAVNGDAIYGTRALPPYREGRTAFARKGDSAFAIYLPDDESEGSPPALKIGAMRPASGAKVRMLGVPQPLTWKPSGDGFEIEIPEAVRRKPPCRHAWAFQFPLA